MKPSKRVKRIRFHTGVGYKARVVNSLDDEKDKVEMELHPAGIIIHTPGDETCDLIAYSNAFHAILYMEQESKK